MATLLPLPSGKYLAFGASATRPPTIRYIASFSSTGVTQVGFAGVDGVAHYARIDHRNRTVAAPSDAAVFPLVRDLLESIAGGSDPITSAEEWQALAARVRGIADESALDPPRTISTLDRRVPRQP